MVCGAVVHYIGVCFIQRKQRDCYNWKIIATVATDIGRVVIPDTEVEAIGPTVLYLGKVGTWWRTSTFGSMI